VSNDLISFLVLLIINLFLSLDISLDVDLPIECDDEYWEVDNPEQAFQQPPDRPSYITSWNMFIKLLDILGFAQRALVRLLSASIRISASIICFKYAVRRSDFWKATGMSDSEWNAKVVLEIDLSLKKWIESIPSHRKYNSRSIRNGPNLSSSHSQMESATTKSNLFQSIRLSLHFLLLGPDSST
jgi:hypothetical protein